MDITRAGLGGLDTGTEAIDTWYHIWVISNGSIVSGLLSASPDAPEMPQNQTYKAYVGAIYINIKIAPLENLGSQGTHYRFKLADTKDLCIEAPFNIPVMEPQVVYYRVSIDNARFGAEGLGAIYIT